MRSLSKRSQSLTQRLQVFICRRVLSHLGLGFGFHFDCRARRSQPRGQPCAEGPGDAVRNLLLEGL